MNIYILGAGAGAEGNCAPMMSDLLERIFFNLGGPMDHGTTQIMGPWDEVEEREIFRSIFDLMDKMYQTNLLGILNEYFKTAYHPSNLKGLVDLEDFFTKVDDAIEAGGKWGLSKKQLMDLREKSKYMFFHTICYETGLNRSKYYQALVRHLIKSSLPATIISFNYDLLVERCLWNEQFRNFRYYQANTNVQFNWSYGFRFDTCGCAEPFDFKNESKDIKILYLKLHGSFNWMKTENNMMHLHSIHPEAHLYKNCFNGQYKTKPTIITPTLRKNLKDKILMEQWKLAERALESADNIHIIGYSLPKPDISAHELLTRKGSSFQNLILVNPNSEHRFRFEQIFRGKYANKKEYQSFSSYLQNELKEPIAETYSDSSRVDQME